MKKLLVLMLVLGLVSTSYATATDDFILSTDGSTLSIIGTATGAYDTVRTYAVYDETSPLNSHSSAAVNANAGNAGVFGAYDNTGSYTGFDFTIGDVSGSGVQAGEWLTFTSDASAGDWYAIYDVVGSSYNFAGSVTVVPEPMTIALLGLGGLFLRRRK